MTRRRYRAALARLLSAPTLPKLGLTRMQALVRALGEPQRRFKVLHIAGTKGKGSTAAMASSMLTAAGYRVGLTISPHLLSARERIVIDTRMIGEDAFCDAEERVQRAALLLDPAHDVPSFFERIIAMAWCAFADAHVDVAVVETGLGGRLDATNVVAPVATAITRLGIDHREFLGDTLAEIAAEKAGIFKGGVPALTVAQAPQALQTLQAVAAAVATKGEVVVVEADYSLHPALFGAHQIENASLARALVRAGGFDVDDDAVRAGLASVVWPGRYETVSEQPLVILDGAHNAESARALLDAVSADERVGQRPRHFVIGMSRGHDLDAFVTTVVAQAQSVIAVCARHPRAVPAAAVARIAARTLVCDAIDDVAAALAAAVARAACHCGVVIVTGSLFVVGAARACYVPMASDPVLPGY